MNSRLSMYIEIYFYGSDTNHLTIEMVLTQKYLDTFEKVHLLLPLMPFSWKKVKSGIEMVLEN